MQVTRTPADVLATLSRRYHEHYRGSAFRREEEKDKGLSSGELESLMG